MYYKCIIVDFEETVKKKRQDLKILKVRSECVLITCKSKIQF